MSGYVASARIVGASPRVAVEHVRGDRTVEWRRGEAGATVVDGPEPTVPMIPIALAERCGRLRDRWLQLTFFVTDPESWR